MIQASDVRDIDFQFLGDVKRGEFTHGLAGLVVGGFVHAIELLAQLYLRISPREGIAASIIYHWGRNQVILMHLWKITYALAVRAMQVNTSGALNSQPKLET